MYKDKMGFSAPTTRLRAYYDFSKPGIVYANVLTAVAGYLLAAKFALHFVVLTGLLFGLALLIIGACAANNCLDTKLDVHMQRTKRRALITGLISRRAAMSYAATMSISGMAILLLTQNTLTVLLAVVAYVDYVVLYGIAKRRSVHGTLVGCVSGAIPLVAGYTAITAQLDSTAWLLFGLMVAWQMAHFYGIALYRLQDYAAAKIPVMPAVYGAETTKVQVVMYMLSFIVFALLLVLVAHLSVVAGLAIVIGGCYWLYKAVWSYQKLSVPIWGKQVFLTSLVVMLLMTASLSVGHVLV